MGGGAGAARFDGGEGGGAGDGVIFVVEKRGGGTWVLVGRGVVGEV